MKFYANLHPVTIFHTNLSKIKPGPKLYVFLSSYAVRQACIYIQWYQMYVANQPSKIYN